MTNLKRMLALLLCVLLLGGCAFRSEDDNGFLIFTTEERENTSTGAKQSASESFLRCCWVSYLELNPNGLTDETAYRAYLQTLLRPLRRLSVTELFVQVRPFCDAIYPTELFDTSKAVVGARGKELPFDYLSVILDEAAANGMRVHAWINPYRVLSSKTELSSLGVRSAAGKLMEAEPDAWMATDGGVFLQPASSEARRLILDGVRELLQSYDLAGIHIDDYYYPPSVGSADAALYEAYTAAGGALAKDDWRREQVNALLRGLFRTVHSFGGERVFSVSPAANLRQNNQIHYADAALWCSEAGFCDWIVPQLYVGFRHETLPFERAMHDWLRCRTLKSVRLIGGLALYKAGKDDPGAGSGKLEWQKNDDVLARQAAALQEGGYDGIALYSAQFVNFQQKACQMLETVL